MILDVPQVFLELAVNARQVLVVQFGEGPDQRSGVVEEELSIPSIWASRSVAAFSPVVPRDFPPTSIGKRWALTRVRTSSERAPKVILIEAVSPLTVATTGGMLGELRSRHPHGFEAQHTLVMAGTPTGKPGPV